MEKHPLESFRHCPRCGGRFVNHDARSRRCEACGFTFYHNASAAVAAFIMNGKGELLVARRKLVPARGTKDLPGGFVDPGESLEDALCREVREETGARLTSFSYWFSLPNVYRYSGFDVHTTDAFFVCEAAEGALKGQDDVEDLTWLPLSEVRAEDFGLRSIREAVSRFLQREHGLPGGGHPDVSPAGTP